MHVTKALSSIFYTTYRTTSPISSAEYPPRCLHSVRLITKFLLLILTNRSITDYLSAPMHSRKNWLRRSAGTPVRAGGCLQWYAKPYQCFVFSKRTASCERSLTFANKMITRKRMYHLFQTRTPFTTMWHMPHSDPNWICQKHMSRYM